MLKSRPLVTVAGVSQILKGSRMAEWLRPRYFIAENGLHIRRISEGSKSCPSRKSIGGVVGDKTTSRRYYGGRKPNFRGQDGRVVKTPILHCRERTTYTPDKRGIEILLPQESP